ncbi:MAG: hypothetical protein ACYC5O_23395, partial [Anaerolineae bacterium]
LVPRVEFPILVDDLGAMSEIRAEEPCRFLAEVPHVSREGASFVVRCFPVAARGVQGEIYVLAYVDQEGESWASAFWAQHGYPDEHPQAVAPRLPGDLACFHGVTIAGPAAEGSWSSSSSGSVYDTYCVRVDYRDEARRPNLGRTTLARHTHGATGGSLHTEGVQGALEGALSSHLADATSLAAASGWTYRQRLVHCFPLRAFWASQPGTIRLYTEGHPWLASLNEVQRQPTLTALLARSDLDRRTGLSGCQPDGPADALSEATWPAITGGDIALLSESHRAAIFADREPVAVRWTTQGQLAVDWHLADGSSVHPEELASYPCYIVGLPDQVVIGAVVHKTTNPVYGCVFLNAEHVFAEWLVAVFEASLRGQHGLTATHVRRVLELAAVPIRYTGHECQRVLQYLDAWRSMPDLPPPLVPPPTESLDFGATLRHPSWPDPDLRLRRLMGRG